MFRSVRTFAGLLPAIALSPLSLVAQWSGLPGVDNPIVLDGTIVANEARVCADGAGGAV